MAKKKVEDSRPFIQKFIGDLGKSVRLYVDPINNIFISAEDVAIGLGFVQTQNKNGKIYESVRWERVNKYLSEFGFPPQVGESDFIPENMFYRLAMKADNEKAKEFQAWIADEVLPNIRKHGSFVDMNHKVIRESTKLIRSYFESAIARLLEYGEEINSPEIDNMNYYALLTAFANRYSKIPNGKRDFVETNNLIACYVTESAMANSIYDGILKKKRFIQIVHESIGAGFYAAKHIFDVVNHAAESFKIDTTIHEIPFEIKSTPKKLVLSLNGVSKKAPKYAA